MRGYVVERAQLPGLAQCGLGGLVSPLVGSARPRSALLLAVVITACAISAVLTFAFGYGHPGGPSAIVSRSARC